MSRAHVHPIPWTCRIVGHAMANAHSRNVQFAEDFCLRPGCPGTGHAWSEFEADPTGGPADHIRHCTVDGCTEVWRLRVPDMSGVNPTIEISQKAIDDFDYTADDLEPRRPDRLGKRGTWVAPRTGGYTPTDGREPGEPPTGPAAAHNVPVGEAPRRKWESGVLREFIANVPAEHDAGRYAPDYIAILTRAMIASRPEAQR